MAAKVYCTVHRSTDSENRLSRLCFCVSDFRVRTPIQPGRPLLSCSNEVGEWVCQRAEHRAHPDVTLPSHPRLAHASKVRCPCGGSCNITNLQRIRGRRACSNHTAEKAYPTHSDQLSHRLCGGRSTVHLEAQVTSMTVRCAAHMLPCCTASAWPIRRRAAP